SSLLAMSEETAAEAERVIASKSGEPWHEAATAALAREGAADYETHEEIATIWNDMAPAYFSQWDERYRPAFTMEWLPPEPLRQCTAWITDTREAARAVTA